ncbi:MAG TPA: hypothetical protein VEX41_07360 [Candidatus Eisenbacteria bacterium]|nr:hypothetical protein [Candidatus Eisenbacteria bacterium]
MATRRGRRTTPSRPASRHGSSHHGSDGPTPGLERWKARWPAAAAALEPADVLVDGMRGRATLWYRVRLNLTHVPEVERSPQEPLDPDYDPWAGGVKINPCSRGCAEGDR